MNRNKRNSVSSQRKSTLKKNRKELRKAFVKEHSWTILILLLGIVAAILLLFVIRGFRPERDGESVGAEETSPYTSGFLCSTVDQVPFYNQEMEQTGSAYRGVDVTYSTQDTLEFEGKTYYMTYFPSLEYGYVCQDALTQNKTQIVQEKTVYVRTPQNLRLDENTIFLGDLVEQGTSLQVLSYDYLEEGQVHLYRVSNGDETGFISGQYVASTYEEATEVHDRFGSYAIHSTREDIYGGGDAGSLDYYPRIKPVFEENPMPESCYCLYLTCDSGILENIDAYIEYAKSTNINAFVVNIMDGTCLAYPSEVFAGYSPSAYAAACNTSEEYRTCIQKIKDAGFYVIGRMTTFNDYFFVADHPEYAISDAEGEPLYVAGSYWPSAFCREVWEYKVALAVDAVEQMGFHEIQFDYVRFPDGTYNYEEAGDIDYRNAYGETKAQAIQRFLMYAADILHTYGVYVGADVFGETSGSYVTAYGQYWPAISNVVDVISGMPYPDHFAMNGSYRPWEHPYDTISEWASAAAERQKETATPAVCRTWIQTYDAIRSPYNTYGAVEVAGEILALQENGLMGGFMSWNATCSLDKMQSHKAAYDALSPDGQPTDALRAIVKE